MEKNESWIVELASLAAASPQIPELVPLEVGFKVDNRTFGLDLLFGRVTDGSSARSWLTARDEDFASLVFGDLTLQRAHLTGIVKLSGEPEGLLRLAFLLDAAHARRRRESGGALENGSPV